ncbi:MAG: toprim domain-containing protein [Trueperaceae bacterium]
MSLDDAIRDACGAVGLEPPKRRPTPGRWTRTNALTKNGKGDGSILIFDDETGGLAWNHQTSKRHRFKLNGTGQTRRDPEAERKIRQREREREAEQREVEAICAAIVRGCRHEAHPYLKRKGFPDEVGLVCDDPREFFPDSRFGQMLGKALPEGDGPFLIIPGRVGGKLTTVQFITPDGAKKNILRGVQGGAFHRIATGRDTWVCEGIATALSVRAALRLLGASATVLSAFSASNVAKVAEGIPGARIAADHDKPVETLDGLGAGEFYARRSRRPWTMPPAPGDFNDWHQRDGLRAVALHLREALG